MRRLGSNSVAQWGRFYAIAFLSLWLIQIVPLWILRYFPTQDGPSHLYNAAILANYGQVPAYRDFYTIHLTAAGNVLSQILLSGLLKAFGAPIGEKILLTIYALLLPASFWWLLTAFSDARETRRAFALFGLVLLPNFFLYMGFWNFCLSVALLLLTLGLYWRQRRHWAAASLIGLATLAFLVYSAHLISWVVLAVVVGLSTIVDFAGAWREQELGGWARHSLTSFVATVLPAIPALLYFEGADVTEGIKTNLRGRLWPLCSLSFLHGPGAREFWSARCFAVLVATLLMAALVYRVRAARIHSTDMFLLFSAACALLSVCCPDSVAASTYARDRLSLYAWLFAVFWLAAQHWQRPVLVLVAVFGCAMVLGSAAVLLRNDVHRNHQLAEFVSIGPFIPPGSTILAIQMADREPIVDPLLHAVDLIALDGLIDLRNYEASLPYFPTAFRPERSPVGVLGKRRELESAPPVFNIERYEETTKCRVDYVLAYAGVGSPELSCCSGQLARYEQVYVSRPSGLARLYRRRVK
jgi:hypothetical protein